MGNDETDNLVYLRREDGTTSSLGDLEGKIDITEIYTNLLEQNMGTADGMRNPFDFRDLVKGGGDWDLKVQSGTIYGLGNDGKTQFNFDGTMMESQDVGNHHFGAVAQDFGFPLPTALRQAGEAQMRSGTSKPEWQVYKTGRGKSKHMLGPYGDDPRDQA